MFYILIFTPILFVVMDISAFQIELVDNEILFRAESLVNETAQVIQRADFIDR